MTGILNVREDPYEAKGDGVADDTQAIQDAIDDLARLPDLVAPVPPPPGTPVWPPFPSAVYFPAGIYRITAPIQIPWLMQVRLFGDGGQGGHLGTWLDDREVSHPNIIPLGTTIQQDTDREPIFVFRDRDTQSVLIERLGFRWTNQQEKPRNFEILPPGERQPSTYIDPEAVAILFSAGGRDVDDGNYAHITVRDCRFEGGWRGIAIDDTWDEGEVSVWNTLVERCSFHAFRGAAISLIPHPDHYNGMPSNAILDCFIENYSNPRGIQPDPGVEYSRRNVEAQLRFSSQMGMRIAGMDAEGSKTRVLTAFDCQIGIRDFYTEHLKIGYPLLHEGGPPIGTFGVPYPSVFWLGGGEYVIDGLNLDGTINARNPITQDPTFSRVVFATAGAGIELRNPRGREKPPVENGVEPDLNRAGFHVEHGPGVLVHTNGFGGAKLARFRTTGPLHVEASSRTGDPFALFDGSLDGHTTAAEIAAAVQRDGRQVRVNLGFPSIPPGEVRANTVLSGPGGGEAFPGARPGDVVTLGPPANLPSGLIAFGLVTAPDQVSVRILNGTSAAVTPPSGVWTVAYGAGNNNLLQRP